MKKVKFLPKASRILERFQGEPGKAEWSFYFENAFRYGSGRQISMHWGTKVLLREIVSWLQNCPSEVIILAKPPW